MISYLKQGKSVEAKAQIDSQVRSTVENIIADVERRGDAAVRECIPRNSTNGIPRRCA